MKDVFLLLGLLFVFIFSMILGSCATEQDVINNCASKGEITTLNGITINCAVRVTP